MPSQFNTIQRGELQQRLTRGLLINDKAPAPTLDPTVQATVLLEDLTRQNVAAGPVDRRCGGGEVIGAALGFIGSVMLLNPFGSGSVLVVEEFSFCCNGTSKVRWGFASAPLEPLVLRPFFYDFRNGVPNIAGVGLLFAGATQANDQIAQIVGRVGAGSTTNNSPVKIEGLVLLPGSGFQVANETVNQEFSAHLRWVEYAR